MKTIKILAVIALLMISVCSLAFFNKRPDTLTRNLSPEGFAVIELFTSEGCSSCPPADELMGKIQREFGDKPVYILAYHIDYWNRTGWKDPFSDVQYSNRQFDYSRILGSQMYTPQVVLNGRQEFVGSDEPVIRESLKKMLGGVNAESLKIAINRQANAFQLHYQFHQEIKRNVLRLAIVQTQLTNKVQRGENGGRTLVHWQTVRQFNTISLTTSGEGIEQVQIPEGFNLENWEIIGFIQNPKTGEIVAATKASFLPIDSAEKSQVSINKK